jgi:hypothetical protein
MLDAAVEMIADSRRIGKLVVRGTSMLPTLGEGQTVAVDFSPERLKRGDVIVFRQHDDLVVHRLVGYGSRDGRTYYRARGDGRGYLDPPLYPERVAGRVVALRDRGAWRSLRGGAARLYGLQFAWHDYCWAAAGVLARAGERMLSRVHLRAPLTTAVQRLDQGLLRVAHRLLFVLVHRPIGRPEEAEAAR